MKKQKCHHNANRNDDILNDLNYDDVKNEDDDDDVHIWIGM